MTIPNDGGWGKSDPSGSTRIGEGGQGFWASISALSKDWMILACLLLTATLCFGLGLLVSRQAAPSKDPLWIEQLPASELPGSEATSSSTGQGIAAPSAQESDSVSAQPAAAAAAPAVSAPAAQSGQYVASKSGTKYYLPSCATAKRIKDENRVYFATKAQAEAAGYQPSSTCKGM